MSRRRLLLVCYACRPGEGSEPGLGWNRALAAAREHDVWVLCEEGRNRTAIEAHIAEHGPIPGLQFIFVPRTAWQTRVGQLPGMFYVAYRMWHSSAYRVAAQWHGRIGFDLVHMVTYCGYREPGLTWKLPTRFVWGPIGGTHNFPWRFLAQAGLSGAICELVRNFANTCQFRFSRRVRGALHAADLAIAGNSTTQRHVRDYFGVEMPVLPANGIAEVAGEGRAFRETNGPTRLLWVGRLHPLKGLPLLLRALSKLPPEQRYELRIIGDGPARSACERLARRLKIDQLLEWRGWVPHRDVHTHYAWADAFVFTSLRDTLPGVVLESLANGLPVITLDLLGMADVVSDRCGIKVPVTTPRQVIDELAAAIVEIVRDPQRWEARSEAAVQIARHYTWDRQAEQLNALYSEVMPVPADTTERMSFADTLA